MVKTHHQHHATADFNSWLAKLASDRPDLDVKLINKALEYIAEQANQEENLQLSLLIADICATLNLDENTIIAALYLPIASQQAKTANELSTLFNDQVGQLIIGTRKMHVMSQLHTASSGKKPVQLDKLRKMLLAMAEDVRIVLIKLAEQLAQLRLAKNWAVDKKQSIAERVQHIYAPLANRLGVAQIKWELEDLSFRYLSPHKYKEIATYLDEKRIAREDYIQKFISTLNHALEKENIQAEVSGRVKHIYSIWRKMQRKNLPFSEIYDIRAVRIITQNLRDCYGALGVAHQLWSHIPKEFDDYIANPKENGYQSLHTAVIGPEGKTIEIQIRTQDMHDACELGIASHWRYKEGVAHDPSYEQKIGWLRQLLDWQAEVGEEDTASQEIGQALLEEQIYVFTPQGKVIDLRQGATPLDFAYQVHTEIGHRCRGAKIGGKIVPLNTPLKTGDQVEILTTRQGVPSRDWLNPDLGYVHTSRARQKIHAWFKGQNRDKNCAAGREILEREIHRLGLKTPDFLALAEKFNFKAPDQLFTAIGAGDLKPLHVLHAAPGVAFKPTAPETPIKTSTRKPASTSGDISVHGVGNLMTHMALCCKPLPGDPIVGYVTQGRGITIHRQDCNNLEQAHVSRNERLIDVNWGESAHETYPVDLRITAFDRQGLLRDISQLLAQEKINLIKIESYTDATNSQVHMQLTVEIPNLHSLGRLIDQLHHLPNILTARRTISSQSS